MFSKEAYTHYVYSIQPLDTYLTCPWTCPCQAGRGPALIPWCWCARGQLGPLLPRGRERGWVRIGSGSAFSSSLVLGSPPLQDHQLARPYFSFFLKIRFTLDPSIKKGFYIFTFPGPHIFLTHPFSFSSPIPFLRIFYHLLPLLVIFLRSSLFFFFFMLFSFSLSRSPPPNKHRQIPNGGVGSGCSTM
jgi:hypothetical protein